MLTRAVAGDSAAARYIENTHPGVCIEDFPGSLWSVLSRIVILSAPFDIVCTELSPSTKSRSGAEVPTVGIATLSETVFDAILPHAQRMENMTSRMMASARKMRKDDDTKHAGPSGEPEKDVGQVKKEPEEVVGDAITRKTEVNEGVGVEAEEGRGSRIDKGKTKVSVVGFDGANQDSTGDDE
jgi:hypothetical protein